MAHSPGRKRGILQAAARMSALLAAAVLTGAVLTGCASSGLGASSLSNDFSSGLTTIAVPVDDVNLEAMVPPGGRWLTAGPLHGTGSAVPAVSLARDGGFRGTVNAVFFCHVTGQHPVTAAYTYGGDGAPMPCDPGPATVNTANNECGGDYPCTGQSMFSFEFPNTAGAVMPAITIPAGASWTLFAWLAPSSTPPGAGVTADNARLSQFTGYGVSFTYPKSWHSLAPPPSPLSDAASVAFEGTAPLPDPCPVMTNNNGDSGGFPCGSPPVINLAPDGVLVYWSMTDEKDTDGGDTSIGQPRELAGRTAWLFSGPASAINLEVSEPADTTTTQEEAGPTCQSIGATWVVEATVPMNAESAYQMLACIRGPKNGPAVKEALAMASSLRLGVAPGA